MFRPTCFLIAGIFSSLGLVGALNAGEAAPKPTSFELNENEDCQSGYSADLLKTKAVEKTCAEFDLDGYEASAFQGGIGIGEVGDKGLIRPFWALTEVEFNTEPRPLPNPAVSPFITFRFLKDETCPSGYAGELLNSLSDEVACLMFNIDGTRGEGVLAQGTVGLLEAWEFSEVEFY